MSYTSQYPVAQSDTYVKATTKLNTDTWPYYATDPAKSLTGTYVANQWLSNATNNQRFHIDLGSAKIIRRIYYENAHQCNEVDKETDRGSKTFVLQGSNEASAFSNLTYATDTNWTTIATSQATFDRHSESDAADPKYITVTNGVPYRYYAIKIADNWGDASLMGFRRIVLQTEDGFPFGGFFAFM